MDLGIKGRVALVTASSRGLGFACAKELASEGAVVILTSRNLKNLEHAAKAIKSDVENAEVHYYKLDLTVRENIEEVFDKIKDDFGKLDILVYSTGGPKPGKFLELSYEDWLEAFKIVGLSPVLVARRAAELMIPQKWGRMVFIGSTTLVKPMLDIATSNIMRMPLVGLVRTLAIELAPYNITVNAVLPSLILTDRVKQIAYKRAKSQGKSVDEVLNDMAKTIPLGRIGEPHELAAVVAFLASERASFITGALIPIDGGKLLT